MIAPAANLDPGAGDLAGGVWAIVPAAGHGRRMGRAKQALSWGDSTLAATVVATLLRGGVRAVIVVTRSELLDVLRLPDDSRVRTVVNDKVESEMIDSIRAGLRSLPQAASAAPRGVLVVPADMPRLTESVVAACLAAFRAEPGRIIVASRGDRRGHPLVFPLWLRREVDGLRGGLRQLAERRPELVRLVECADDGVMDDIDTPADYARG